MNGQENYLSNNICQTICLLGVEHWLLIYCAPNALYNTIPPIFIFQMVLFMYEFLRGVPTSYIVFISLWIDDVKNY